MNTLKNIFYLVLYSYSFAASAQFISVDDTKTAQQLIENVLVKSDCANVSNFNAIGDTYTTGQNSYGYFNANGSNFPLNDGVLLCTYSSRNAIGPYNTNIGGGLGGGDTLWLGDADLNQSLGINSINATILEFDFVPLANFISFNYFFASNEYQSYFPCDYSDGFAFLIKEKGSNDNYKNLAVLPDTTTPVSSKNIHPLINSVTDSHNIIHPGCPAINESYFNGFNTNSSPINYSGQTIKLNAQTNVVVGKTYHIKLVIADDGPKYRDSAVFLEAGSFSAKIDLGSDQSPATNNPVCFGQSYTIDTKLPAGYSYTWYKNGSPILGETKPVLNVTDAGTYKVAVVFTPSTCKTEDEIKIEYAPQILLNNATLVQCDDDGDGISIFDLTKVDNIIKNNDPNLGKVVYFNSLDDAQSELNPIQNPTSFTNTTPNQTLFAKVTNTFGCANYAQLELKISNNNIGIQNPIEVCDEDAIQDGITQFDLNAQLTPQVINGLTPGLTVEYYETQTDAIVQKNKLPNLFRNTIPNQQTIYARIVNGPDCYKITPETLIIYTFDPPNFQEETVYICNGSNKILTVDSGYSSYLWSNGNTTNSLNVNVPGDYTVTVTKNFTNLKSCEKTKKFIVKPSEIGTITGTTNNDFAGNQNSVLIQYSGIGNYEFSLDGNYYQDNPLFSDVKAGTYFVTARDKNGCGISIPYKIYILDYPRFFSPNNDGYNDFWTIKNLDIFPNSKITIFDRYGKLLKEINSSNNGWNGNELPADDYWFILTLENGRTIKGHFSLIR